MTTKMSDDEIALGLGEVLQQLASARAKFKEEREAADTKVAERLRNLMSTCFDGSRSGNLAFQLADMEEWIPKFTSEWKANHRRWLELCTRLGRDALDLEQRGRVAEVDAIAGEALELKRIRSIVDEDARKRHGDREGEPSWGVIADCVLAHVSQHRQAREILDVPEQFTLDQYVSILGAEAQQANEIVEVRQVLEAMLGRTPDPARSTSQLAREVVVQAERWQGECASLQEFNRAHIRDRERACAVRDVAVERHRVLEQSVAETNQYLRDFETGLVNAGKWDTHPELPLNLLAREVVAQAERWRIDAEYYQGEASNATARQVESLSAEVARLTGEVAATRAEAKRQIAALELAGKRPPTGATALRHNLATQLRAAAKTANAWEEAAIREWEPIAPNYHEGDGTVTAEIEGPYLEHRLVMAWRGQVQRMAANLGADVSEKAPSLKDNDPPGFTIQRDHLGWLWRIELHRPSAFRMSCQVSGWTEKDARQDAWERYESRKKLQAELDELRRTWATTPGIHYQDDEFRVTAWPFALMLSQDECNTVERWLVDSTAEMPEVLRG